MRTQAFWAFCAGCVLAGCPEPPAPADPSLARDVLPLFSSTCSFSSCHGGSSPQAALRLGPESAVTPSLVQSVLVNVPTRVDALLLRVKPGDADASFLIRKVEGRFADLRCFPDHCGERMPQRTQSLSERDVQLLRNWVTQGAKEN